MFSKINFLRKNTCNRKIPLTTRKCLTFKCQPFFSSQISLNFKPRALETALSSSSWQEEIAMTPSSQWRFLRFPWNPEVKEPRANTYPQYVRSCSVCFSPLSTISKSHWQIVHISRKTSSSISLPSSKLTISGLLYLRSSQCLQVT